MIKGIHHISMKCGTKEEFGQAKDFYLNVLGFSAVREWPEGIMIDSGSGLLEIFCNGTGIRTKGAIRHVAFSTDDVDGITAFVKRIRILQNAVHDASVKICNLPEGQHHQ